jgi:membrane protein
LSLQTKFKLSDIPGLILESYKGWFNKDPFRLSAVIAYYAVLSLPGLLVIIVNLIGSIWGNDIVQGQLINEISGALGQDAASSIKSMIIETQDEKKSFLATILGVGTLLYGATGVFYHLQLSINEIWNIESNPKSNFIKLLRDRVRSFGFIMVVGFLLLVSFIITAGITSLNDYLRSILPDLVVYVVFILDLLALIFKYLPDAKIQWKSVWIGAIITAILFVFGKSLLSFYFGQANPGSTYGAASTIVLILLWVSYSCLILFFGAQFTMVYSKKYGFPHSPRERLKN